MIADPLQVAERLSEKDIGFWMASPRFQTIDMSLARLEVETVELILHTTSSLSERVVGGLEGA